MHDARHRVRATTGACRRRYGVAWANRSPTIWLGRPEMSRIWESVGVKAHTKRLSGQRAYFLETGHDILVSIT